MRATTTLRWDDADKRVSNVTKNAPRWEIIDCKPYQIFNKSETSVVDKGYHRYANGQP